MADTEQPDYTSLTVQLLSAYVANNTVASEDLATLIQSTRAALIAETVPAEPETIEHVPAVSVRKSIASREHILSLIDGRPYKTLKRHLATHGLTPADYRARYGLPETYPMVAQAYSDQRRAVAQKLGLGQRGTQARVAAAAAATQAKPATPPVKAKASVAPKADVEKAAKPAAAKKKASAKVPASTPVVAEAPKPEAKKAARVASKPKAEVTAKAAPAAAESVKPKSAAAKAPAAPKAPRKKLGIKAESGIGS